MSHGFLQPSSSASHRITQKLQRLQAEKNTLAKGLRELQRLGRSTLGEVVVFLVGVKIGQKTHLSEVKVDFWMGFLQLHIFLRGHGTVL